MRRLDSSRRRHIVTSAISHMNPSKRVYTIDSVYENETIHESEEDGRKVTTIFDRTGCLVYSAGTLCGEFYDLTDARKFSHQLDMVSEVTDS